MRGFSISARRPTLIGVYTMPVPKSCLVGVRRFFLGH
jgi:hypothetical protein